MGKKTGDFQSQILVSPRQYFVEMVETGLTKRKVQTYPAVQSYLVDLLQHYLDARNLNEKSDATLAEMYLTAASLEGAQKIALLKVLADRSLYISGFFGDSLKRKLVDLDYYVEIGGAAYAGLATYSREDTTAAIYRVFAKRFHEFVDVLTYISEASGVQSDESVLRLYERFVRTGSELAKEKLLELGVMPLDADQIKLSRQD